MQIAIDDPEYPETLRSLPDPPLVLTTSGRLQRRRAVAIVGSREASEDALRFAHHLAFALARAGIVVVSGGAVGIDAAAHRGAMAAQGATWVVSPTGRNRVFPPEHHTLFAEVAASAESRMLWSFADDADRTRFRLRYRNGVLAALSEALVVVQARFKSGSRNAAAWARSLGKPVWAVTAFPWTSSFSGSLSEIESGRARPLCSIRQLMKELRLDLPVVETPSLVLPLARLRVSKRDLSTEPRAARKNGRASLSLPRVGALPQRPSTEGWSDEESRVFSAASDRSIHLEEIAEKAGLPIGSAVSALLTLSLKDVVVEGPDGFFRRRSVA